MAIFGRNEEKYTGWAKIDAKLGLIKKKKKIMSFYKYIESSGKQV